MALGDEIRRSALGVLPPAVYGAARIARDRDGIVIDDTTWAGIIDAAGTIGLSGDEIKSLTGS